MNKLLPLLLLATGACAHLTKPVGDRGMETPHQPVVGANGAYVPGCPDWSSARGQAHEGQSSNYGCATMSNLAAMVADPDDLLHGKGDGTGTGDLAAKAIKQWREIAPTGKNWVVTTDVGKTGGPK